MLVYILHEKLAGRVKVKPEELREAGDKLARLNNHHWSQLPRDQEVKCHVPYVRVSVIWTTKHPYAAAMQVQGLRCCS